MFGLFGKKKSVLEPLPQGSVPSAPSSAEVEAFMAPLARQTNSSDEPIIPKAPGKIDDFDSLPDFGAGMPRMPMPKNEQIDIPDVKIPESRSIDFPDFSDYSSEQITDSDLSKLDIDGPESSELQQLKSAVGEPVGRNRPVTDDKFELPDFPDHEAKAGEGGSADDNETATAQPEIHEDALPGFADDDEESISQPSQGSTSEQNARGVEEENLSVFGSEPKKKEQRESAPQPMPMFSSIRNAEDASLPAFDIRETTFNQQLFIDARDYERLLKETIIIDALAKRTTKRLMKIKDVSGNQSKLLEKYHADLSYINEKLDHIDRVIFEQR